MSSSFISHLWKTFNLGSALLAVRVVFFNMFALSPQEYSFYKSTKTSQVVILEFPVNFPAGYISTFKEEYGQNLQRVKVLLSHITSTGIGNWKLKGCRLCCERVTFLKPKKMEIQYCTLRKSPVRWILYVAYRWMFFGWSRCSRCWAPTSAAAWPTSTPTSRGIRSSTLMKSSALCQVKFLASVQAHLYKCTIQRWNTTHCWYLNIIIIII